jgi:hypothetical protein
MARKRANRETSDAAKQPNQRQRRYKRGEGSVYQRASDGLWVAVLGHGVVGGKRRRTAFYAKKVAGARQARPVTRWCGVMPILMPIGRDNRRQ